MDDLDYMMDNFSLADIDAILRTLHSCGFNCSSSDILMNLTDYVNTSYPVSHDFLEKYKRNRSVSDNIFNLLVTVYLLLIIVGTIGNSLVIYVVVNNSGMRTPRNFFIVNLAVSDLLLSLLTMPFTLLEILQKYWTLGEILCKLICPLQSISIFVSTLSITAIALDRYFLIMYPTKKILNTTRVAITLVLIWVLSIIMVAPLVTYKELVHEDLAIPSLGIEYVAFCNEQWNDESNGRFYYSLFALIFQYSIPIATISCAYSRIYWRLKKRNIPKLPTRQHTERRHKTNILIAAIAFIFAVSWLPLNVLNLSQDGFSMLDDEIHDETYAILFAVCHLISMSSACSNPLLYGWLNDNFRKEFGNLCCCFSNCQKQSIQNAPPIPKNDADNVKMETIVKKDCLAVIPDPKGPTKTRSSQSVVVELS